MIFLSEQYAQNARTCPRVAYRYGALVEGRQKQAAVRYGLAADC